MKGDNVFNKYLLTDRQLTYVEIAVALVFCCLPLFITFPYKINLYLAWEGAYRMSIGQFPFKDFGMPLGYGFWIIPSLFFKIFGPFMSSLIKAQVLINLISVFALSSIWRAFRIPNPIRVLGIFVFCTTYVFIHFWGWYNHTVFVYELIAVALLVNALLHEKKYNLLLVGFSGFFTFLSLFTKQDIGGLGLLLCSALIILHSLIDREFRVLLVYGASFVITGMLFILPLSGYDFSYWFNYGQFPHSTRINGMDFADDILGGNSIFIRIYIICIIFLVVSKIQNIGFKSYIKDKRELLLMALVLGFIVQAMLAQVTSYIPANAHYYYHSFFIVFLLSQIKIPVGLNRPVVLGIAMILILFWWSNDYWKYGKRVVTKIFPAQQKKDYNQISKKTWKIKEGGAPSDRGDWKKTPFKSLDNIYMPESTIEGMKRIQTTWKGINGKNVLNMSEIPQLAYELGYEPPKGIYQPLWFHQQVAFFERETEYLCEQIENQYYDLIIFEDIPSLNNFYPATVHKCLQEHYKKIDSFLAPRIPQDSQIEVYVRL